MIRQKSLAHEIFGRESSGRLCREKESKKCDQSYKGIIIFVFRRSQSKRFIHHFAGKLKDR